MTGAAARTLLAGLVDYAGLFPPASLTLEQTLAEYARWRRSPRSWMLGRLVLPATRLPELAGLAEVQVAPPPEQGPWRLSALCGEDLRGDLARVTAFNAANGGRAVADAIELRARGGELGTPGLPPALVVYVELPLAGDLDAALEALGRQGARAKIRTGGVSPDSIPAPGEVARFLAGCAERRLPFKATAGLHHALRRERPLTFLPDGPRAVMHGFLNVFAAAAFVWQGAPASTVEAVLREEDASCFRLEDGRLAWREWEASNAQLAEVRRSFACSFGSCSFAEPVADLEELGVIG